ncbi:hypothetical protein [Nostoc sp. PCC 7107]|uniref:hypothetical protein n=1 Tax=Nostoc sp. PCC 7107 TaxID=317936 RepID=UPI00029ED6DE|nr:hypothetical protein [Nostoc sp. PCC 7107]AFY45301.1 hypothetical protein Nos7107_4782 [Nostoc sp. PCC 7107]
MYLRIKRRQFGQLVIASAATNMLVNLVKNKTLAQEARSLVGVKLPASKNKQNAKISTDVENTSPAFTLVSLDLTTGGEKLSTEIPASIVDNQTTKIETAKRAFSTESSRITGFTSFTDGTMVMLTVETTQKGNHSKLIFTDNKSKKPKAKKISGFKNGNHTIEGVLGTKNNKIIGIASANNGVPPFYLVMIDPKNGKVTSGDELKLPELPRNLRFSNLALSPDGKFYATILTSDGRTTLVQLDPNKTSLLTGKLLITTVAGLTYNRKYLSNDLLSLTFSPSGQLIALANPNNSPRNSVFAVDIKTGNMTLLSQVNVDKIAFIP